MTSGFLFYHGTDKDTLSRMRSAARSHWGEIREVQVDAFSLFISLSHYESSFAESSDSVGAISGYVRSDQAEHVTEYSPSVDETHNRLFVADIIKEDKWPLGDQWTGSFSAVTYSKADRALVLCTDPIGYFPLYYVSTPSALIGGTSLIVLSQCLDCEADVAGILQRITPPYCNYGRRTLLKPLTRLLPGEWMKFSDDTSPVTSVFDNTLCNGVMDGDANAVARKVWDCLQLETVHAAGSADRVCVGMSGGWDSRLALGGLKERVNTIDCYTYGSSDLYETQIARRCSYAAGAQHESFTIEEKYFPSRSDFGDIVSKTEAALFLQWFTIIDAFKEKGWTNVPILLGDAAECLDGRHIKTLSSREARTKSFLRGLVGKTDEIPVATAERFNVWKERKQAHIISNLLQNRIHLSQDLLDKTTEDRMIAEIREDLELGFSRVWDNLPAFAPMFDELFHWFHVTRDVGASQNLMLASTFDPLVPALSMRFMRLISTVPPALRLRRRLIDAIARLPEFDGLAEIPSAQIPWLSARASTLLREVVWGLRSKLDQLLIRRVLRTKSPTKRQRVLRSLDLIKEYRREDVVTTVHEWFSGRWVNPEKYIETVKNRRGLLSWPLINLDIAAPANTSIILDLCDL